MPPRRSCFADLAEGSMANDSVSMPPRRSCFSVPTRRPLVGIAFQCHHGVPASVEAVSPSPAVLQVSMPPRRSCFQPDEIRRVEGYISFNATTAFLLRCFRR